ncbi:MAG TPA: lasso peptide biosynthesis B2 protein [Thermoanaerobaculia bacterium]|nr:lasso peptide biosynthesis B2 protein [Thermoanaerobaculia bacterium]
MSRLSPTRILLFAAAAPLLLRFVDLERLGRWLEPANPARIPRPGRRSAEDLVWRVDRLLRLGWPVVRRGCLVRGLTLYRFLREAGFDVSLCFGLGRPEGEADFTGHCWIEMDGRALAEKREPRGIYTETYRLTPPRGEAPAMARPTTA